MVSPFPKRNGDGDRRIGGAGPLPHNHNPEFHASRIARFCASQMCETSPGALQNTRPRRGHAAVFALDIGPLTRLPASRDGQHRRAGEFRQGRDHLQRDDRCPDRQPDGGRTEIDGGAWRQGPRRLDAQREEMGRQERRGLKLRLCFLGTRTVRRRHLSQSRLLQR